jgi:hypothetical protein
MGVRRFRQCGLTVLAATIVGILAVTPASAGRPDHFSIDYDAVPDSLCGMSVVLDGFEHGTFQLKRRRDGTELAAFNVHFRIRVTNTATGRWLLVQFNGSSGKELKVTDEGGGIIAIVGQVAGIERYSASDGSRVFQAAGNTRVAIRIDLRNPNDPDDDVVLNEQKIKSSGLRFGAGDCDAIRALIG